MKVKVNLKDVFSESEEISEFKENDLTTCNINTNKIKQLTMDKIRKNNREKFIWFKNGYTKIACILITALLVTTGSAYAFSNEIFQNFISELIGVAQTTVLKVGESVSNNDYELKVHEIVTDLYVGYVVVSIEALSDKSKKDFDNYSIDLQHLGSGHGLGELEEYREQYIKYYEINFSGAINKNSRNDGKLEFSPKGMIKSVEVQLTPTVERVDMNIQEDNSNGNRYKFNKIYLSEIGLTLEGADTRNMESKYLYNIELLLSDDKKVLVCNKINENDIDTPFINNKVNSKVTVEINDDGSESVIQSNPTTSDKIVMDTEMIGTFVKGTSSVTSGDINDYVYVSVVFFESIPLDTIKQIVINDIAYDIVRN